MANQLALARLRWLLHDLQFCLRFLRPRVEDVAEAVACLREMGQGMAADRLEKGLQPVLRGKKPSAGLVEYVQSLHASAVQAQNMPGSAIGCENGPLCNGEELTAATNGEHPTGGHESEGPHDESSEERPNSTRRTTGGKRSVSVHEADSIARKLDKKSCHFRHGTAKEWAAAISKDAGKKCSATTAKNMPFWTEVMTETGRRRGKGRPSKPLRGQAVYGVADSEAMPQERLIREETIAEGQRILESVLLGEEEREATLEKLARGEMQLEQVAELATLYPKRKQDLRTTKESAA